MNIRVASVRILASQRYLEKNGVGQVKKTEFKWAREEGISLEDHARGEKKLLKSSLSQYGVDPICVIRSALRYAPAWFGL